jgi:ABC-type sulfate transport system permease component
LLTLQDIGLNIADGELICRLGWSGRSKTALHSLSRVNSIWLTVARNLGASEGQIQRPIIFPAIRPDVLTGLRLAIGWTWIMIVSDEMLGVFIRLGLLYPGYPGSIPLTMIS